MAVPSIHKAEYQLFIERLIQEREHRQMTQSEVGSALGRSQSDISKIERCERRLDMAEFVGYAHAIGADPVLLFTEVVQALPKKAKARSRKRP